MKLKILPIICLINYVFTFPNDLFDELWETNQTEPQANNNPIESQPKIKLEPHGEQFDGRWRDESALKGIVKIEHEPHYGSVKVEGTDKIKHESADDLDQDNSKEHLSDQNNSTDQDENVDKQQNDANKCGKIESDQQKREIIQKFREMKEDYKKKRKYSSKEEWPQIERKISSGLGICRTTIYKWIKKLGLRKKTKSKFSELEKREILKKFNEIKSKCKKAKLKISMRELDEKIAKRLDVSATTIYEWSKELGLNQEKFSELEKRKILKQFDEIKSKCKKANLKNPKNDLDKKIAKKLGVCRGTIYNWKHKFGLSVINKKFSDATKIGILKKYAKIKGKNPKMSDCDIAVLLKISTSSLIKWKAQFREGIKKL